MLLRIYAVAAGILFYALFPALWCFVRWRPAYREHFRERLGFLPLRRSVPRGPHPLIWIHAVSLGEVKAAAAIIDAIRSLLPGTRFVVSTATPHGRRLAQETFRPTTTVLYAPLDVASCVYRSLRAVRPDALVFLETEIWPMWITGAARMGVRTLLVNGRISPRSVKGYLRLRPFFREVLSHVDRFSMISEEDAERILAIGAQRSRISVNGNAKFDSFGRGTDPRAVAPFRRLFAVNNDVKVIVAGSTRSGEEEILLEAFRGIQASHPEILLVIAPRHLERVSRIEQLAKRKGLGVQLRTTLDPVRNPRTAPVVLLDTFGELFTVYGLATVVFCGASLVPLGGQNPLEPAAWGKMVLYGPSMDDFKDARALLESHGGGETVDNGPALSGKILSCFSIPGEAERRGARGREAVLANLGAAERHARIVLDLISRSPASPEGDFHAH